MKGVGEGAKRSSDMDLVNETNEIGRGDSGGDGSEANPPHPLPPMTGERGQEVVTTNECLRDKGF